MKLKIFVLVFVAMLGISSGSSLLAQDKVPDDAKQPDKEPGIVFTRHQFTVNRQNGKIHFDGIVVANHFRQNKNKEISLIEFFDNLSLPSDGEFNEWARKLRGPRTYTYDEVTQIGLDGQSKTQPLVFFSKNERAELDIQWQEWLDKRQADLEEANRLRMAQEREANLYQQQAKLQQLQTQALVTQATTAKKTADSLAVISGETSLWEIELLPAGKIGTCLVGCSTSFSYLPYTYGYETSGVSFNSFGNSNIAASFGSNWFSGSSFYVKSYGRNSQAASYNATQNNPGYRVGTIRKLAGY